MVKVLLTATLASYLPKVGMMKPLRIAILISGRGSNMKALVANLDTTVAEVVLVAADKDCAGIDWAVQQGIPTWTGLKPYSEDALNDALIKAKVDLICLAGFMRILSKNFVKRWENTILNIHPSLLPSFPGLDTHARALARGVKYHGCTVHYVDAGMDTGPILDQSVVPVLHDDTEESLAARVLKAEHKLYSSVLGSICEDRRG